MGYKREMAEAEQARLEALQRYRILDSIQEAMFDRIAKLAQEFFGTPIALISLVEGDRQWFKSCYGLDVRETSREVSFCAYAIELDDVLVVPDATQDERFKHNALVTGEPGIRFYAGAPLRTPDGFNLGSLCVIDTVPRSDLDERERSILEHLASLVVDELEARLSVFRLNEANEAREKAEKTLRERNIILETLNRTGRALSAELDLRKLVQILTDAATQLSGAQFGAFFYNTTNDEGEAYSLYTLSGVPREAFERYPMPRATKIFSPTFHGEGTVRFADVTQDPRYGQNPPYHGMPEGHLPVRSYLAVPITSRSGEPLGGLFLGHPEPDVFTHQSEYLVESIAAQAATALDNAYLFDAAQRELRKRREVEQEVRTLNAQLEQRVLERTVQLEAINKELEAFSYSVSHDLRAPLRGIDGFSRALLEDYGTQLDADALRYLKRITGGVDRMKSLIDGLLNLSRLTRSEMHFREVDLSILAQEIAETLRQQEPERTVHFSIERDLRAFGDERLLRVVLENLIGNAWKFTRHQERPAIDVGAHDPDGSFFVRDNGAGFDMAYANKLFIAFQRLHSAEQFQGSGIGLATVQRIIHRHGGQIWAESEVGRGATFYFTFAPQPTTIKSSLTV